MTLSFKANCFREALAVVMRSRAAKSRLPVLTTAHLRLDSATGLCEIRATDLSMETACRLDNAQVTFSSPGEWEATVDPKLALGLLGTFARGTVEIEGGPSEEKGVKSSRVTLTGPRQAYTLKSWPADGYPKGVAQSGSAPMFTVDGPELADAMLRTLRFVSLDDGRPVLTGILVEAGADGLRLVATDTHRLYVSPKIATDSAPDEPYTFILPPLAAAQAVRLLAKSEGARIRIGERLEVESKWRDVGLFSLQTKSIDGTYPSYQRVIPDKPSAIVLTLDAAELRAAIERAQFIARQGAANRCVLHAEGNGCLRIRTESTAGESCEEVGAAYDVYERGIVIAMNCKYLIDAMDSVVGADGVVRVEIWEPLRPIRISADGRTALIMPMQVV